MAREEHDREDLLAEATALKWRVEFRLAEFSESVVIGFRRQGEASLYLGADVAYHFNARNELRRAFDHGRLIKAENRRLSSLTRRRRTGGVDLVRHDFTNDEQAAFVAQLRQTVHAVTRALAADEYHLVGQVPADENIFERCRVWLGSLPDAVTIAMSPRVEKP